MPACRAIANATAIVRHQLNRLRSRADVRAIVYEPVADLKGPHCGCRIASDAASATKAAEKYETLHHYRGLA
jgi:hypothetical protein